MTQKIVDSKKFSTKNFFDWQIFFGPTNFFDYIFDYKKNFNHKSNGFWRDWN